jgi:hypothetical protein
MDTDGTTVEALAGKLGWTQRRVHDALRAVRSEVTLAPDGTWRIKSSDV